MHFTVFRVFRWLFVCIRFVYYFFCSARCTLLLFIAHFMLHSLFQLINNHHANKFFSLSDHRLFAQVFVSWALPLSPPTNLRVKNSTAV